MMAFQPRVNIIYGNWPRLSQKAAAKAKILGSVVGTNLSFEGSTEFGISTILNLFSNFSAPQINLLGKHRFLPGRDNPNEDRPALTYLKPNTSPASVGKCTTTDDAPNFVKDVTGS